MFVRVLGSNQAVQRHETATPKATHSQLGWCWAVNHPTEYFGLGTYHRLPITFWACLYFVQLRWRCIGTTSFIGALFWQRSRNSPSISMVARRNHLRQIEDHLHSSLDACSTQHVCDASALAFGPSPQGWLSELRLQPHRQHQRGLPGMWNEQMSRRRQSKLRRKFIWSWLILAILGVAWFFVSLGQPTYMSVWRIRIDALCGGVSLRWARESAFGSVSIPVPSIAQWKPRALLGQAEPCVFIPMWMPVVLSLLAFIFIRPQNRIAEHECTCGYDLTGNESGICPECGTAIKPV